ncbi:MAG: phosphopentomutase [Clostridium sp.]
MKKYNRIFTIVIDSLGIGALEDSKEYGDEGVDTLGNIAKANKGLNIPNLQRLGIANLREIENLEKINNPLGYRCKLKEASVGKDTMTGHWEMMGLHITSPFKTFTDTGFPKELLDQLSEKTGHKIVGNISASGTEILDKLGEHQMKTGDMIVYTSADSVLQICGHEETFGLEELYRCCEIARDLTFKEEWKVGRIIARPYLGEKAGAFKRTSNRHDYALKPYGKTALDVLKENGLDVISVGKISDIFDGEGITESHKSKSSIHGMDQTIELMDKNFKGLCFVNLVDFDALWGHRRDPIGYAKELESFDIKLGEVINKLKSDDLLIITADHGNDPTYKGSDHTREYVPFLAYSPSMKLEGELEVGECFGNIGATIVENFQLEMPNNTIGKSVLKKLI